MDRIALCTDDKNVTDRVRDDRRIVVFPHDARPRIPDFIAEVAIVRWDPFYHVSIQFRTGSYLGRWVRLRDVRSFILCAVNWGPHVAANSRRLLGCKRMAENVARMVAEMVQG